MVFRNSIQRKVLARVLIVDDVSTIRKIINKALKELGHDVVGEATNGQEAVNQYAQHEPDVVTMDISMPVLDGIDAVEIIIQKYPNANIIMLSSQGMQDKVVKAIKAGAKAYLLKPVSKASLKDAISKLGY